MSCAPPADVATPRCMRWRDVLQRMHPVCRLEADKQRSELERATVVERAKAEAEGRIQEARELADLRMRQLQEEGRQRVQAAVESAREVAVQVGSALRALLRDPAERAAALAALAAAFASYFAAREGARVASKQLERLMGRPGLVRETSRALSLRQGCCCSAFSQPTPLLADVLAVPPWGRSLWWWLGGHMRSTRQVEQRALELLGEVVLEGHLHARVEALAKAITNTRARQAPFRHVMFWGPPGTGKTMAAERLARGCGLDYAMMSGGDVLPLGG